MLEAFLFIFGLFFGSFLNVIIDRLPRKESFWKGRSYCENCKHTLKARDLIPLLSFISTKGTCRYCHVSLSGEYPLLEVLTGITYAVTYFFTQQNGTIALLFGLFITSVLIVIFFIDLHKGIIPFSVVIPAVIVTLLFLLYRDPSVFIVHMITGFFVSLFFFLLFAGTKGRGMGFGDVVYAFFMGLLLGFPESILGLYIAFLTGAAISLILVLLKRKKLKGSTIPFGPFLVIGTYIAFLYGTQFTNYFFTLL